MKQPLALPNDINALRELVIKLRAEVEHLNNQKAHLHEQIRLLLHKRFGANSEKYHANQADLFNEAEIFAEEDSTAENKLAENGQQPSVFADNHPTQTTANKPGRKVLPAELPRVEIIHDLPANDKFCTEGHALKEIGAEISEQLDIIPAKIQVLRHIRKKYACPCCQTQVKIAPLPAATDPQKQRIASPVSLYCNG